MGVDEGQGELLPLAVLFVCVVLVAESCPWAYLSIGACVRGEGQVGVHAGEGWEELRSCQMLPAAHCLPAHRPMSYWEGSGAWCVPMVHLAVLELLSPGTSIPAQGGDAPRASAQGAASSTVARWQRGQAQLVAPWSWQGPKRVSPIFPPAEPHHHPVLPHTAALGLLCLPAIPRLLLGLLRVALDKVTGPCTAQSCPGLRWIGGISVGPIRPNLQGGRLWCGRLHRAPWTFPCTKIQFILKGAISLLNTFKQVQVELALSWV